MTHIGVHACLQGGPDRPLLAATLAAPAPQAGGEPLSGYASLGSVIRTKARVWATNILYSLFFADNRSVHAALTARQTATDGLQSLRLQTLEKPVDAAAYVSLQQLHARNCAIAPLAAAAVQQPSIGNDSSSFFAPLLLLQEVMDSSGFAPDNGNMQPYSHIKALNINNNHIRSMYAMVKTHMGDPMVVDALTVACGVQGGVCAVSFPKMPVQKTDVLLQHWAVDTVSTDALARMGALFDSLERNRTAAARPGSSPVLTARRVKVLDLWTQAIPPSPFFPVAVHPAFSRHFYHPIIAAAASRAAATSSGTAGTGGAATQPTGAEDCPYVHVPDAHAAVGAMLSVYELPKALRDAVLTSPAFPWLVGVLSRLVEEDGKRCVACGVATIEQSPLEAVLPRNITADTNSGTASSDGSAAIPSASAPSFDPSVLSTHMADEEHFPNRLRLREFVKTVVQTIVPLYDRVQTLRARLEAAAGLLDIPLTGNAAGPMAKDDASDVEDLGAATTANTATGVDATSRTDSQQSLVADVQMQRELLMLVQQGVEGAVAQSAGALVWRAVSLEPRPWADEASQAMDGAAQAAVQGPITVLRHVIDDDRLKSLPAGHGEAAAGHAKALVLAVEEGAARCTCWVLAALLRRPEVEARHVELRNTIASMISEVVDTAVAISEAAREPATGHASSAGSAGGPASSGGGITNTDQGQDEGWEMQGTGHGSRQRARTFGRGGRRPEMGRGQGDPARDGRRHSRGESSRGARSQPGSNGAAQAASSRASGDSVV